MLKHVWYRVLIMQLAEAQVLDQIGIQCRLANCTAGTGIPNSRYCICDDTAVKLSYHVPYYDCCFIKLASLASLSKVC